MLATPDRVNDGLVAAFERAPLDDVDAGKARVALELDAVNHAQAEACVARVGVLPDGDGDAHARDLLNLVGARDRQREALRAAHARRAGGAHHDLRADLRLAPPALA